MIRLVSFGSTAHSEDLFFWCLVANHPRTSLILNGLVDILFSTSHQTTTAQLTGYEILL